jgi:hypothetical protein
LNQRASVRIPHLSSTGTLRPPPAFDLQGEPRLSADQRAFTRDDPGRHRGEGAQPRPEWLEKTLEAGSWELPLLKVDPIFETLRADRRFPAI